MLKRIISPTFQAKVKIPVYDEPGFEVIRVTYKYRDRDELKVFMQNVSGRKDPDLIMDIISGWEDVEDEFCKESVEYYCSKYHGFAKSLFDSYLDELTKTRIKN